MKTVQNAGGCSTSGVSSHKSGRCKMFGTGIAFEESRRAVDFVEFLSFELVL